MEAEPVEEKGESEKPDVQESGVLEVDACALLLIVAEDNATAN